MSTKIIFEERETREITIKEDCILHTFSIASEGMIKLKGTLRTERGSETSCKTMDVGIGSSVLMVNAGTSYEFQRLDAMRLHRAINDSKLSAFLQRVVTKVEDELRMSALQRQLTTQGIDIEQN